MRSKTHFHKILQFNYVFTEAIYYPAFLFNKPKRPKLRQRNFTLIQKNGFCVNKQVFGGKIFYVSKCHYTFNLSTYKRSKQYAVDNL